VKVPVWPEVLEVMVGWTMIKMLDESTNVDFKFQRKMVDKYFPLV
jgi:hypothetical protein